MEREMINQENNKKQEVLATINEREKLSNIETIIQKRTEADLSALNPKQQLSIIKGKVSANHELPIVPNTSELLSLFIKSKESKKPLIVKFGIDPTGRDIHIGHMVSLIMADRLLRMGHKVIMVVGDFTAKIGDGSGRESARKPLSDEQILENLQSYKKQAAKIIDIEKIDYRHNSEWLGKINIAQIITLAQKISANKMWQREDFQKRLEKGDPVSMAELMYPIFMGMDSVELQPDIELGGLDQYLNLLWCRELMKLHGQKEEVFLSVDLIPGTDGRMDSKGRSVKMSKSLKNYIAVNTTPNDMYGKVMSIPDNIMWIWLRELTELYEGEIENLKKRVSDSPGNNNFIHPMDLKKMLARLLVGRFNNWDQNIISTAEKYFESIVSSSDKNQGMPEGADVKEIFLHNLDEMPDIFKKIGNSVGNTSSQIRRLLMQNGIKFLAENNALQNIPSDPKQALQFLSERLKKIGDIYLRIGKRKFVHISKSENE